MRHVGEFLHHIGGFLRHPAKFLDNGTQFNDLKGLIGSAALVLGRACTLGGSDSNLSDT